VISPTLRHRLRLSALLLPAFVASCAVGPDFEAPAPPSVDRFTPERTASPGGGQRFHAGAETPARWWEAFQCRRLDDLVAEAIANNPTLEAAEASLRAAEFNSLAATGALFPQVSLNSFSSYQEQSGLATNSTVVATPYSFFTKSVQVAYTLDIWGANARNVESLDAQRDIQRYQREAAYTALAANAVKAAIEEASLRGQIRATRRAIDVEEQRLALLRQRHVRGESSGIDVVAEEAQLAQTRQALPLLETRLEQQRNLLIALAGRYPSEENGATFELSQIALPQDLPLSLPSAFVQQRPDIKAAEANVHSASAQVGVAVAARLPNIVLTANGNTGAFQLGQLFTPNTLGYTLAGSVAQTAFDGFTLYNKQRAAEASLEQAKAQYRDAVIKAFQNVADVLRALQGDAQAVASARADEDASRRYLEKIRRQKDFGEVSGLEALNAERSYLAAATAHVQAKAQRLTDTAGLFMALGGGWRNGDRPAGAGP
jgi:NodT family efflux transporter outer membrane factor (OMF) lipoprotein